MKHTMKKNLYSLFLGLGLLTAALMSKASAQSQTHTITISQVFTNTSATTWTVPVGVTSLTVECYGGGGGGTKGKLDNATKYKNKPNGGGGGAYAASTFSVTAGTTYYICAGAGGAAGQAGNRSWFNNQNKNDDNALVYAAGGSTGGNDAGGVGGTVANSRGDTKYAGGTGGTCTSSGTFYSGAGGGAAGPNGAGGNAADNIAGVGNGGRAGNGGAGGNSGTAQAGFEFGGGGSGGLGTVVGTEYAGGAGAQGAVLVTYDINYTVQNYEAVQGSVVSLDLGIESINGCEIHWYDQNHNPITTASTYSYIKGAAEYDTFYVRLYDGTTPLTDEMQILVHLVSSSAPEGYSSVVASQIFNSTSPTTWTVPSGVTSVTVECYGGGGAGQKGKIKNGGIDGGNQGNGGGGGAYASSTLTVEPGTTYYLCAGQGGNNGAGNASWFGTKNGNNNYTYIVSAAGGAAGAQNVPGAGGQASASIGTIRYSGGTGGMYTSSPLTSGAGGGAAGPNGNGGNANAAVGGTGNGGRAGNGANGLTSGVGLDGSTYGGGGSGGMCSECAGGAGGNGIVSVTYEVIYLVHDYESESGEWVDMDLGIASNPGCEIYWYDSHNNLLDVRGFYSYVKTTAPCDTFYVQLYDGANPLTQKQRILVRRICPEAPEGYTAMPIGESCWLMSNVPGSQDSLFTYDEVTSMDQNGCPYGWYLPSKAELQAAFDGLQETFIYPGYYRGATSAREGKGILEFFWTRDNLDTNSASRNDIAYVTDDCDQVMESPSISDNDAYSIRCVQDPNVNTHYHLYKFAVSETDSVYFSQGNLQYLASNDSWKFATEQFDYIGNAAGNTTPMPDRATQNNWIDLYGWGTSGWDNGNMYYRPYDIYINGSDDGCLDADDDGYGPVYCHCDTTINDKGKLVINCTEDHSNLDLTPNFTPWGTTANGLEGTLTAEERAEYEKSDWGRYIGAEIINGGRTDWRTLTLAEWHFLMNQRDDAANKEAHATINGVQGIIFLPEFWDWNNCPNIPHFQTTHNYADNVYTMAQWRRMEYYGAMFLPAAGHRNVGGEGKATDANGNVVYQAGVEGEYWASTAHPGSEGCAHPITFVNGSDIGTTATHTHDRAVGRAVRLVRNCDTDESGRLSNNQ